MTNINAAIGLSQLARLDEFIANRRRVCETYNEAFVDVGWLTTPDTDFADVGPFIYTVRALDGRRAALIEHMKHRGIDTGIHFLPLHQKTLCAKMRRGPMTVTETVGEEIVTLPLWSIMPNEVIDRVIDAVTCFQPARALARGKR